MSKKSNSKMDKKIVPPKFYEFSSVNYKEDGDAAIRLSCISRAIVDSVVSLSATNALMTVNVTDSPTDSVWFKVYCNGLPNGDRYILVDPSCTCFMSMLNYNKIKKHTVLKLTTHDREILAMAVNLYMSKM